MFTFLQKTSILNTLPQITRGKDRFISEEINRSSNSKTAIPLFQ